MQSNRRKWTPEERSQLLPYLTAIREYRQKITALEEEQAKWSQRMQLAAQKQRQELVEHAERKQTETGEQITALRAELAGVDREYRKTLVDLEFEHDENDKSIDPDLLLEQMNILVGDTEKNQNEEAFRDASVEVELEKLKTEIRNEE